jgi:hypothetical protein
MNGRRITPNHSDGSTSHLRGHQDFADRLHRARLFFRHQPYPAEWTSAKADLRAARALIEQCGYWRRKEELEDAERAILGR